MVNTSATIPAAVDATAADGTALVAAPVDPSSTTAAGWSSPAVPTERPRAAGRARSPGRRSRSCGGGAGRRCSAATAGGRLWTARLDVGRAGAHVAGRSTAGRSATATSTDPWPLDAYQNVYATEPGSAEMPSAGRPFTRRGDRRGSSPRASASTPLVLHTGVASLEADELPYPERFAVPAATAERVNATRAAGGRVVAVGTTVVRALETAVDADGRRRAGSTAGPTSSSRPSAACALVDGLLTGWHEPEASHLLMLEAVAGRDLLERSYEAGLAAGLPLARVRRRPPPPPVLTTPILRRNRSPSAADFYAEIGAGRAGQRTMLVDLGEHVGGELAGARRGRRGSPRTCSTRLAPVITVDTCGFAAHHAIGELRERAAELVGDAGQLLHLGVALGVGEQVVAATRSPAARPRLPSGMPSRYLPVSRPDASGLQIVRPRPMSS